jgi:cystathionine beta-synthase
MVPVVSEDNKVLGVVTEGNLTAMLVGSRINPDDDVACAIYKQFRQVALSTPLSELASIFDRDHYALVVTEQRFFTRASKKEQTRTVVAGVVTRIDLLNYISHGHNETDKATNEKKT